MRLINAETLEFKEFQGEDIPEYAILSHTWDGQEVTFRDWEFDRKGAKKKNGYTKIVETCRLALEEGLDYAWVDTCCIDKSSSAELSEAINSMFEWYARAKVCFAFLSDVMVKGKRVGGQMDRKLRKSISKSRWFTRGWTLQELLAPSAVVFYSNDWIRLGYKSSTLTALISDITGIDTSYLLGRSIIDASVSLRMFWLSQRKTTRVEDMAYCMLGMFGINMPLLYGEGAKAFVRLQEEIIKVSVDHTIFCWSWTNTVSPAWTSLIAPSPDTFKYSKDFRRASADEQASPYSMTNVGLSIRLPIIQAWSYNFIVLMVRHRSSNSQYHQWRVCIPIQSLLRPSTSDFISTYMRIPYPPDPIFMPMYWASAEINMFVVSRMISMIRDEPLLPYESEPRSLLITIGEGLPSPTPLTRAHINEDGEEFDVRLAKTIPIFHAETFPQGLFDETRSVFRLTHRVENGWNGLLALGNRGFGCVIFISCKIDAAKKTRWFCHILPLVLWREDEAERRELLKFLESQVTSIGQNEIRAAICPEVGGYFGIDEDEDDTSGDDIDRQNESKVVAARLEIGLKRKRIMELSKDIRKQLCA
ncbi:hypothetical protein SS1G_12973 [Sclerotinia sclerotiorum 1980 UF-70]|uniref:Heterokaryon incompatibility domain-containing protein n=2 Tax=Sclerotinia sclerotiorum (strain ATCC 18683 / 1980 / Ss-1) TaxID=665079 RepID=A7F5U5_SCLS1|nr:hypothetical protein SS1G_12973 [Sclerotinia sclerotiorum 1980 UF-70]APA07431.1 hypothetical protein sscle_02g022010 [Sclerotinia sclerotiorum 1980 UF-70]EDN98116.1 hypothetical protein SS1G_12973 [Sclerotinia sclerotiorum 1980 UF-70]